MLCLVFLGGVIGAATTNDKSVIACLECGTSWKAQDLYKIRKVIEQITGLILDLSYQEDRVFLNDFITEIPPYLDEIAKKKEEGEKLVKESDVSGRAMGIGCMGGGLMSVVGCTVIASVGPIGALLGFVIPIVAGGIIGFNVEKANENYAKQRVRAAQEKAEKMIATAEDKLIFAVDIFVQNHPL